MDTPRNDDGARALTRLPVQWRNKPRFRALAQVLASEAQAADAALYTLWTGRQLETAAGAVLEVYGRLVGEERLGRGDDAYRVAIRARQLLNRSNGTAPELLHLLRLLAPAPLPLSLEEYYPAGVIMRVTGGPVSQVPAVFSVLHSAKPAGVALHLHHQDGVDADRFVFAGGVGRGFGGSLVDVVSARRDVQPLGYKPGIPDSGGDEVVSQNGAVAPLMTATGGRAPDDLGSITVTVLDVGGPLRFTWSSEGGYGNDTGQVMFPGGVATAVTLVNQNASAGPAEVGFAFTWDLAQPYVNDDSWIYEDAAPSGAAIASTPPTLTAIGALVTGRVVVEVVLGAPGYTFRYTVGSAVPRTVAMQRGAAVVLLRGDGTSAGLTLTWPNVTTLYAGATYSWQVVKGNAAVGGRLAAALG